MFLFGLRTEGLTESLLWLMENRDGLSILVHPRSPYGDLWDHDNGAMWLGPSVELDMDYLREKFG